MRLDRRDVGSPGRRFDGFDVLLIQVITSVVYLGNFKLALHALSLKALGWVRGFEESLDV